MITKAAFPRALQNHIKEVKERPDEIVLVFQNKFIRDHVRKNFMFKIKEVTKDKKVCLLSEEDDGINYSPEVTKLLDLLSKEKASLYDQNMIGALLYLFSSEYVLEKCAEMRKQYSSNLKGGTSEKDVYWLLVREGLKEFDTPIRDIIQSVVSDNKKKEGSKKLDDEKSLRIFMHSLSMQRFKEEDWTAAVYDTEKDTVFDVVNATRNYNVPQFYFLPMRVRINISKLCEDFGIREDIYGDMLTSFIFLNDFHVPTKKQLPNGKVPAARILFHESIGGFSELKVRIYHDSDLDEVISLIKSKRKVIEQIQKNLLPPEKWKRRDRVDLKKDTIIIETYQKIKDYKQTIENLSDRGIEISHENLRKKVSLFNKERKRISQQLEREWHEKISKKQSPLD